jgi:hypothetical protein
MPSYPMAAYPQPGYAVPQLPAAQVVPMQQPVESHDPGVSMRKHGDGG